MLNTEKPTIDYSIHGNTPVPTVDNWKSFVEAQSSITAPMLYVDATVDILKKLQPLTELDDLQEMKSELTKLFAERTYFVTFALDNIH